MPCHVLTGRIGQSTTTLWIGKDDMLIHQRQNVFDIPPAPPLPTPSDAPPLAQMKQTLREDFLAKHRKNVTEVETLEIIQLNQPGTKEAFIPKIPAGVMPVEWGKAPAPKATFE